MNIIVCVKKIQDPEIPPAKFNLDSEALKVIPPEGIPPVINPYDGQAVELALRLKEKHGGKITVITVNNDTSTTIVKHALSMGADQGIVIADCAFEGLDSFSTAYILSQAIKKVEGYDLILCGRQAADWDEGLVGSILAEILGIPLVTLAEDVEVDNGSLKVKRVILDGHQLFSVPVPALVTVSNEVGKPRLPTGWGIIQASRKHISVWNSGNLQVDLSRIRACPVRRKLVKLFIPKQVRQCELIEGKTAAEASGELALRLKKAGVI